MDYLKRKQMSEFKTSYMGLIADLKKTEEKVNNMTHRSVENIQAKEWREKSGRKCKRHLRQSIKGLNHI